MPAIECVMKSAPQTGAEIIAGYKAARARIHEAGRKVCLQKTDAVPEVYPTVQIIPIVDTAQAEIDRLTAMINAQFEAAKTINNAHRVTDHSESEPTETPYPSMGRIKRAVADFYGITVRDIVSARRTHGITRPRQIAMHLGRDMTPRSFPDIGRQFGDRDHTTVLHADRKTLYRLSLDRELRDEILEIKCRIYRLMKVEVAS